MPDADFGPHGQRVRRLDAHRARPESIVVGVDGRRRQRHRNKSVSGDHTRKIQLPAAPVIVAVTDHHRTQVHLPELHQAAADVPGDVGGYPVQPPVPAPARVAASKPAEESDAVASAHAGVRGITQRDVRAESNPVVRLGVHAGAVKEQQDYERRSAELTRVWSSGLTRVGSLEPTALSVWSRLVSDLNGRRRCLDRAALRSRLQ